MQNETPFQAGVTEKFIRNIRREFEEHERWPYETDMPEGWAAGTVEIDLGDGSDSPPITFTDTDVIHITLSGNGSR